MVVHLVHLALQDLLVVLLVCRVSDPLLLVPTISSVSGAFSVQDLKPITEFPRLELYEDVIEEPLDLWLGETLLGGAGDLGHLGLEHLRTGASVTGLHSGVVYRGRHPGGPQEAHVKVLEVVFVRGALQLFHAAAPGALVIDQRIFANIAGDGADVETVLLLPDHLEVGLGAPALNSTALFTLHAG